MRLAKFFALASAALLAVATAAHADPIGATETFFNTPGTAVNLCCFQVVLTQESTTDVQVAVTLLNGAQFFAGTGNGTNHPGFAFDINGLTSANTINVALSTTDHSSASGHSSDDWTFVNHDPASVAPGSIGDFAFQLNTKANGGNTGVTSLTFDVTDGSTLNLSDFVANDEDVYFAADILTATGSTGESGINTPGSHHNPPPTPEPSSLMLLGTGILGAAGLVRRRLASALNR